MAGFDGGTITSKLALDSSKFRAGMLKSQQSAKKFGDVTKKIGSTIKKLTKSMVIAGAAIVGALAVMVRSYIKAGDEIHKMALRTGFSTEALSGLKYAAEITGASIDDLEKGVKKMAKTISDASKAGGALATYVRAFDRINLSAEDLLTLSPEKQFEKITRAIADLESPTLRAALAQEIFGRAGTKLLPLMAEGAEGIDKLIKKSVELGLVWSQEAADSAAKLNDSITTLKGSFTGLTRNLVTELVPGLTIVADHFTETFVGLQEESESLAGMIITMFGGIVSAIGGTLTGLKAFYISMLTLNKQLAEGLIAVVESIELTAMQTGNLAVMMKILPWTAEALEKLNKVRELDIQLIKEEEERLLNLVNFFKDLQLTIDAASRATKTFGEEGRIGFTSWYTGIALIFEAFQSVLPPVREFYGALDQVQTSFDSYVFGTEKVLTANEMLMESWGLTTEKQLEFSQMAIANFQMMEANLKGFVSAILDTLEQWAIGEIITSVMKSKIPFPLNLLAVGGAILAVKALFAALKPKEKAEGGWVGLHGEEIIKVGEKGPEYVSSNETITNIMGGGAPAQLQKVIIQNQITIGEQTFYKESVKSVNKAGELGDLKIPNKVVIP